MSMNTPERDATDHIEHAAKFRAKAETATMVPQAQIQMAYAQYEATLAVVAELRALREALGGQ